MPNESELLSVVIPSRNEVYLEKTVRDIAQKSLGPVEIIVVIEGDVPENWGEVVDDLEGTLRTIHHPKPLGMRPTINDGMTASRGKYVCKIDAHCLVAEGWDLTIKGDLDDDTIMVPRRFGLDPVNWVHTPSPAVDYHRLTYPFCNPDDPNDFSAGIQAMKWQGRRKDREHILLDEELTSQGSCYLMSKALWNRIGPLDAEHYGNLVNELEELGFRAWLSGGRVMVNKKTSYAHWFKKIKRGYPLSRRAINRGYEYCVRYWMRNRGEEFFCLLEQFMPLPEWPNDLEALQRHVWSVMEPV